MKTPLVVVLLVSMTGAAAADGERSPMIGGALTYAETSDRNAGLVGGQLELAWWPGISGIGGLFGLAVEAAVRRGIDDDSDRNLAVAGSARVLVASWMWPSLLEPRDVEMAIELHAIAERTWWSRDDSRDAFGLGAALRMRGGSDWVFSSLLAESRLFVRVMKSRDDDASVLAREAGPGAMSDRGGTTVVVGLGAAFGLGKPRYLERFRLRDLDW
ncbi:MAG: hypothetical protein ACREBE_12240 [bacterium]